MGKNQQLGLIGAALLIAGAFLPVVSAPIIGSMSLTELVARTLGKAHKGVDGYIIIGLAVVSVIIVLLNTTKWLWLTALGSLGIMVYDFINIKTKLAGISGRGGRFGEAIAASISMQWGWVVLALGVIVLIIAAMQKASPKTIVPTEQVANE